MTPQARFEQMVKELKHDVETERYCNLRIPERKIGALFVLNMLEMPKKQKAVTRKPAMISKASVLRLVKRLHAKDIGQGNGYWIDVRELLTALGEGKGKG